MSCFETLPLFLNIDPIRPVDTSFILVMCQALRRVILASKFQINLESVVSVLKSISYLSIHCALETKVELSNC
jgi:hypothetical protein